MRGRAIGVGITLLLAGLIVWVARNTYWADATVPMPPKGEARTNPSYAAERFAEALGARAERHTALALPSTDSVIVISAWHWALSSARRAALERWVETGGRLVADRTLVGGFDEFQRWSGIGRTVPPPARCDDECEGAELPTMRTDDCADLQEERAAVSAPGLDVVRYRVCHRGAVPSLTSRTRPEWALRDHSGLQAMRVRVGRGSVTMINADPFNYRNLFDGDHGRLFVTATELRRGDEVYFLSDADRASLLALLWQHGSPVVALALVLIALLLWRGAVRFGPLAAADAGARRSLAEQIRGTGEFALRYGRGAALHAAAVRALEEAAGRRVPGYASLPRAERTVVLARLSRFNGDRLAAAIQHPPLHRPHELRRALAFVEAARRQVLIDRRKRTHGTR